MMTNAHLHYKDSFSHDDFSSQMVCLCAGNADEWTSALSFACAVNVKKPQCCPDSDAQTEGFICQSSSGQSTEKRHCLVSAGVHPWAVEKESGEPPLCWLERLLKENADEVAAVGECGIDLYTPRLKELLPIQLKVFEAQIELAARYEKPLVIHCRRSIQYFFKYAPRMKKLPAVIFHAFPGTFAECESLLRAGINAYFSFGGVLLRGGKKAVECVAKLPEDRLLLETDDNECAASMIADVFAAAADIRGVPVEELYKACERNFCRAYVCGKT